MDNQQHRVRDCICCSVIFAVQIKHDRNYKRTVHVQGNTTSNPVINVINNVDNSNKISNNSSSNNSNQVTGAISNGSGTATTTAGKSTEEDLAGKIKQMRVEKAISEGRLSDAEMILKGVPTSSPIPTATAIPSAPPDGKDT
jgi:hypothetical protein